MSALDMLEDGFPHGTVDGYNRGCRTNHCPAPIICAEFRTRYQGDWTFRKRVDAGWTVEEIADWEAREEAAAAAAARAAVLAEKAAQRAEAARARRKPAPQKERANAFTPAELQTIRDMHAAGALDAAIARALSRNPSVVTKRRSRMGLERNSRRGEVNHGTRAGYDSGCRDDSCPSTPSCSDEGRRYYRELSAKHRRRDGAPVHTARTHCRRNHELTDDNVFVRKNDGRRRCATCRDLQYEAWNAKRTAKRQAAA